MSAAAGTKIFGVRIGLDPKILVGGLFAIALLLFFMHGRGDDGVTATPSPAAGANTPASFSSTAPGRLTHKRIRTSAALMERGTLRIRPVDATHGNIDPTLRLEMLSRLQSVPEPAVGRSLFDVGEVMPTNSEINKLNTKIVPAPIPAQPLAPPGPVVPAAPQVNIPLKFYGFEKTARRAAMSRGLFLEGDNVVIAAEGDVVDGRYLVVSLTAQDARLEDTQLKQGQTLPVMPAATQQ